MAIRYMCGVCGTAYDAWTATCPVCFATGQLRVAVARPAAQIDREPARASARELAAYGWRTVASSAYPDLALGPGALVLVAGPPGAGKSTWALRAANGLAGPVLYVAAEEGLGPAVAARLARAGVARADFHLLAHAAVDDVVAEARRVRASTVVIDSVSFASWQAADLRHALELLPGTILIGTVHVTKSGVPAGSHQLAHEADVIIAVATMRWAQTKSRYAPVDDTTD